MAPAALAHVGRPAEAVLGDPQAACAVFDDAVRLRWTDYDSVTAFGDSYVEVMSSTYSFPPAFFGQRPTARAELIHRVAESDLTNAFTWNTSTVASGHYLVWSWVQEPAAEPMPLALTHEAPNWVTVVHPGESLYGPTVVIVEPDNQLDNVPELRPRFEIVYSACAPDGAGAVVRLEAAYRGRTYELIADGLPAVADGRFTWDATGLLPGPWIIRASIRDACGRTFTSYARCPLDVRTPLNLDAGARDVSLSEPLQPTLDPDAGACGTAWNAPDGGADAPDTGAAPDALGVADAGVVTRADATEVPPVDEGCGCATTAPASGGTWLSLALLAALITLRRR